MVSRRNFLRGAGGAVLAIPFLESLASKEALAAPAPKRLVVMKSFSTQLIEEWYPTFSGNGYQLHDDVYGGNKADGTTLLNAPLGGGPYTQAPLADLVGQDGGLSTILGPALTPFLDKLTLIRGLDFLPAINHNYGGILGNYSSCTPATPCDADSLPDVQTIDQILAYSSKFYASTPWARHLHVSQGVENSISYSAMGMPGGPIQQLKARTNPLDAYNDMFAGVSQPENPMAGMGNERDKLLVDRVYEDYVRLRDHKRLSSADKQLVEQYINLVSELQAKLTANQVLSCTIPAEPESLENNTATDPTDIQTKWDLFIDIVVAALMCDQTRIVTIGAHKALGPGPDPNDTTLVGHYHSEDASGGTWHGLAHDYGNANSRRMLAGINAWLASELFAKLIERMDVPEADGNTLLDNSLVYWGNEMGFNHIAYSVPCLLAGSAGGFIETGRYLDYIDWDGKSYFGQENGNVIKGIPHNRLLVTIMQAMGLSPDDYEMNGEPGYGARDTVGKDPNLWPTDYDLNAIGDILPGIQG